MNKKGDLPVTILVLGVFVICTLALLSFYFSENKISNSFENVKIMDKMSSKINEYDFYISKGFSEEFIKNSLMEDNFHFTQESFVINKTKKVIQFKPSFNIDDWVKEELSFSVEFFR